ncbi:MAG: helix-turn-helix domain-containing protein [Anaeromyxobacter sp.]|nr:helix-turn-helix domain-containing protein [Anaeromyxobacter sp.]
MEWLTVQDLTQRLRISRAHLYNLINAGTLPRGVRFGRCVRWRLDIIRAAEDRLAGPPAEVAR